MVYVDENGDRDTDIDLLDMEPTTGKFRVIYTLTNFIQYFCCCCVPILLTTFPPNLSGTYP